ncbi:MAG: DUF2130 domain-containing protein [Candidatus Daviesbacteria bacterium]|nr:DUF2130 domain-containing protein [Candidatus Daviesbacteria bacterium]
MKPITITCPHCKSSISVDEALSHQFEEILQEKLVKENDLKLAKDREVLRKQMEEWKREQGLKFDKVTEEQVKKFSEEIQKENKLLKEEAERKEKLLAEARELELKLRQEKNRLDDDKKAFEVEKQRQLDAEREGIRKGAEAAEAEKHKLVEAELRKKLDDAIKTAEELKTRANQGSQQLQGEILELEIETILKNEFPIDEIIPIAKGVTGADVLQKVKDSYGRVCGTIVWESKRTKNWSESWVVKLKEDAMKIKGDVPVLITVVLPEEVKSFGFLNGIFVTNFECFTSLAFIIRKFLIEQQIVKNSMVGKNEKMEMVYSYVLSNEFRQRIETIAEAFAEMKDDLDNEKRVFTKLWAKREKEIERVIHNTIAMHGDLKGLVGSSLPEVEILEIESLLPKDPVKISVTQTVLLETSDN